MSARPLRDSPEGALDGAPVLDDAIRAPLRVRVAAQIRADWLAAPRAPSGLSSWLEDLDDPQQEAAFRRDHPLMEQLIGLSPVAAPASEVARLGQALGLAPPELDIVDLLLATSVAPDLSPMLEMLDRQGRGAVTAPLCARLFGQGRTLVMTETSGLRLWGLIEEIALAPGQPPALALDPPILARLCGRGEPEDLLVATSRDEEVHTPLASWPVEDTARAVTANLNGAAPRPVRVVVRGQAGGGRTAFARCVAANLSLPLLALETDAVPAETWPDLHRLAHRRAFLDEAALAWRGSGLDARPWPGRHPRFPVTFVILEQDQAAPPRQDHAAEIEITLPPPSVDERRALWLHHAPAAAAWPRGALDRLAAYAVRPAEIAAVSRRALPDADAFVAALRVNLPPDLKAFAELPDCTFRWDDLVVADPIRQGLEDFTFEARARADLWLQAEARRLFPQGRALVGLFSGAPGTGKTMAAQVIAAELGLTLCRVNLATITSKWVGETSQRVDSLFRFCAGRNTLLLIDEADALCGRRIEDGGDAQDAHVNRDISHLMMAIENHDGVVILTTNLKGNLDPAFLRRIRHSLEFRTPVRAERQRLWEKMIAALCGAALATRLKPRLDALAEIEATGAQIKNAVLSAHFAASRDGKAVDVSHLVSGIDREFRKEGYGLSPGQIAQARHG